MKKQGLDLLQEKLAEATRRKEATRTGETATTPPLPPDLAEFARQMALRNGVDPVTGEVVVPPSQH